MLLYTTYIYFKVNEGQSQCEWISYLVISNRNVFFNCFYEISNVDIVDVLVFKINT